MNIFILFFLTFSLYLNSDQASFNFQSKDTSTLSNPEYLSIITAINNNPKNKNHTSKFLLAYSYYKLGNHVRAIQLFKQLPNSFILNDYRLYYEAITKLAYANVLIKDKKLSHALKTLTSAKSLLRELWSDYPTSSLKSKFEETLIDINRTTARTYSSQHKFLKSYVSYLDAFKQSNHSKDLFLAMTELLEGRFIDIFEQHLFQAKQRGFSKGQLKQRFKKYPEIASLGFFSPKPKKITPPRSFSDSKNIKDIALSPDAQLKDISRRFTAMLQTKYYPVLPDILKDALNIQPQHPTTLKIKDKFISSFVEIVSKKNGTKNISEHLDEHPYIYSFIHTIKLLPETDRKMAIRTLFRSGEYEYTKLLLKALEKQYPYLDDMEYILFHLAEAYQDTQDYKNAQKYYSKVFHRFPKSIFAERAGFLSAWLLYKLDQCDQAIPTFDSYLAHGNEFESPSLYFKAKCYEKIDDHESRNDIFHHLISKYQLSFYAALARMELKLSFKSLLRDSTIPKLKKQKIPANDWEAYEKAKILSTIGFKSHSINELSHADYLYQPIVFDWKLVELHQQVEKNLKSVIIANHMILRDPDIFSLSFGKLMFQKKYFDLILSHNKLMNPYIILSLMRQESAFETNATSIADAYGLMQLLVKTAQTTMKSTSITPDDLKIPEIGVKIGITHLDQLLSELNNMIYVIASYNAGKDNVKRWIETRNDHSSIEFMEAIPFKETRRYVKSILRNFIFYCLIYEGREFSSLDELLVATQTNWAHVK